eukprot:TRINITY_DN6749_c0_g2_i1.p1 TRINITY_DN6749_c0_g2~~TRINITY_DN6749_c0_g2_i1.p1  ORF type:complete len:558 (-),score=59.56 TRINITY_DN6749_c0_g2_i1:258-1931(-)
MRVAFNGREDEEDGEGDWLEVEREHQDEIQQQIVFDDEQEEQPKRKKPKIKLNLKHPNACKVCGSFEHKAGFVGATYLDCPNKPCYLCKKEGHSTAVCPFRIPTQLSTAKQQPPGQKNNHQYLRLREQGQRLGQQNAGFGEWKLTCAVVKLHKRRITCLQFHPRNENIIVSGDKSGEVGVWNYNKVYERTTYQDMNYALTNQIKIFATEYNGMDACLTSSDGTVKLFDVETGVRKTVEDLNPQGWINGESNIRNWNQFYGLSIAPDASLILAGDSFGNVHLFDPRIKQPITKKQLHERKSIPYIDVNPNDTNLVCSCGNDYTARIWDRRKMANNHKVQSQFIGVMQHGKVVSSAQFSRVSGSKIMTTCTDNRIRVWDSLYVCDKQATREIVHSHDFNRFLTPFRAEWDPKDISESMLICGRYISENFDGIALHPLDFIDVNLGKPVCQLYDPNLTTIPTVNQCHPLHNIVATGTSSSIFIWQPSVEAKEAEEESEKQNFSDQMPGVQRFQNFVQFDARQEQKKAKKAASQKQRKQVNLLADTGESAEPKNQKKFATT